MGSHTTQVQQDVTTNEGIASVEHLEEMLSRPTQGVIETVRRSEGDFLVLGVGGKMGPDAGANAAAGSGGGGSQTPRHWRFEVFFAAVTGGACGAWRRDHFVRSAGQRALERLPEISNVIYMAGMKFGTTGQQARTWAMNTFLPGMVASKFRRSKIVAFSTGNVYPLRLLYGGGASEETEPAPIGEYAMSCLGRERIFEHFSRQWQIPMVIVRLNYAVEMRYGVLVDMAASRRKWGANRLEHGLRQRHLAGGRQRHDDPGAGSCRVAADAAEFDGTGDAGRAGRVRSAGKTAGQEAEFCGKRGGEALSE